MTSRRVPCAGALVYDAAGRLLLIQRGHDPGRGLWSLPGGRVEPGETSAEAAVREVREETGLDVVVERLVGRVDRPGPNGVTYVIDDWRCRLDSGQPVLTPADDAADARFVDAATLLTLPLTSDLLETLCEWDALPPG